jgi:hypothetical protein
MEKLHCCHLEFVRMSGPSIERQWGWHLESKIMRINHWILKNHLLWRHQSVDCPLVFDASFNKKGNMNHYGKTMNWDAQK